METPKRHGAAAVPPTGRARMAARPRRRGKPLDKQRFIDLVAASEDWLMHRVPDQAKNETMPGTPPLWQKPGPSPSPAYRSRCSRPGSSRSSRRNWDRMTIIIRTPRMFLGLMKYYRQSYHDLVCQAGFGKISGEHCRLFIDRFFDRVEIGFCMEWAGLSNEARDVKLPAANRAMTNEKNKYLTIFESLPTPVFFLGPDNRVSNLNQVAAELFRGLQVPGEVYHGAECPGPAETRDPYTSGHQRGVASLPQL